MLAAAAVLLFVVWIGGVSLEGLVLTLPPTFNSSSKNKKNETPGEEPAPHHDPEQQQQRTSSTSISISIEQQDDQQHVHNPPLCFSRPSDAIMAKNNNTNVGTEPVLRPALGNHRPDADAVFAMAAGYPLDIVSQFVGLLLQTGYTGDIVLGTQPLMVNSTLHDYLTWHSLHSHVIVYEVQTICKGRRRLLCTISGLYRQNRYGNSTNDMAEKQEPDPRRPRSAVWIRYELYWIWSLMYNNNGGESNRILLVDSRDVYFQSNPFAYDNDDTNVSSSLHVYQEVYRIGSERFNAGWMHQAYGPEALNRVHNFTILCSGSTLGGAAAIELYARAMVGGANDNDVMCNTPGCDQAHHNYLVYSGKLLECSNNISSVVDDHGIQQIISHPVGEGAVMTVGSMLDSRMHKELIVQTPENEFKFYNSDGVLVPVVHQIDRNETMFRMVKKKARLELDKWEMTRYGKTLEGKQE
jgi:hypothetical protein